ncbi:MAG: hypothetical protein IJ480_04600 [Clostridia bacterium]|nr:hypothetical protein [Clostridia bacterium]
MKKYILTILLSVLVLLVPVGAAAGMAFGLPAQYTDTFLGEMTFKFDRLRSVEGPKVVVVGGSSVAFGLDSAALEEAVGMPVVNFGLYATLGTRYMMDMSKAGIGDGDIVILAPETDPQTMSLYFNAEAVWQAMDQDLSMLRYVPYDNWGELSGGLWNFAAAKYGYWTADNAPEPDGVYAVSSFNEYGDIVYPRDFNIMVGDYDPSQILTLDSSLLDADFIDYVNDYAAWCDRQGASLYYSFSPMNEAALAEGTTDETILAFYAALAGALECPVLSDINDYIMDAQYFYDTNFHLNDTGVQVRTHLLAEDILRIQGDTTPAVLFAPDAPQRPADYFSVAAADDTTGYFLYEENGETQTLTGITDSGKEQTELTLPSSYNGKPVTTMAENALEGCENLKTVVIPRETALTLIYDGAFAGAPKLERINMEASCTGITVADDLLKGVPAACRIYVSRAYYGNFAGDYFWSEYMSRISLAD